ncbi:hypothetical protein LOZ53_004435 [Ophidiomyces ophidiicola]|uniref:Uncharacterized protein n=1 Tax=Ophidiomyces ophidiicola TaxID=1387563 RepID=A0ACB8UVI4_9EURO|nr:uncharacterized protein LOZ57_006456 [Ophidiomyces ophidiicola]KAI1909898.1 hypothetical protein LOZ61_004735 [Ophidiomyces ophidiicola]KAI1924072.1 hypothetical protein LOZ64_000814 [Ophidiomyces ophidiicola]KAI1925052.1 hypothetical protein LOZ60_004331 [Ophidiomyces ophidiicola]KAI1937907.1 hypothetical protein LOZ57_006456 [Ophidiomyces ophidiicola]KAI1971496.1 hypothetical protein LOZ55_006179 [Ophidiomyces ophidiicola]
MWTTPTPTPVFDNFVVAVRGLVQARDGAKLQDFLQLEPPLSPVYHQMVAELRAAHPAHASDESLRVKCESLAPASDSGSSWTAFAPFMRLYFTFLRDVDLDNLLETYELLRALLNQCIVALGDGQYGVIVLPTVLHLCKVLAKLAIGLDRRPELIAHLVHDEGDSEGATEKVTLVEKSANVVREAFIKCLTDRTGTPGIHGKPEGRRVGIYLMANLCLKLLFKCGKLRNAEQMFASINAQSPPLSCFPASQRVTYLYYLGRYLFSNNLFYLAQVALQSSYNQCHRQALQQRRLILSYLITCNIILGRFPSAALLEKPECETLRDKFLPICQIIVRGDVLAFREYLGENSPKADWFAEKGILLQLRNRCEILTWRSLARKVFLLGGFHGNAGFQPQKGPPPFLYLNKLEIAVEWLKSQRGGQGGLLFVNKQAVGGEFVSFPNDPDFDPETRLEGEPYGDGSFDDFISPTGYFDYSGEWVDVASSDDLPEPDLHESNLIDDGSGEVFKELMSMGQITKPLHGHDTSPLLNDIESILASLLTQDLMRGYLTHRNPRYAIPGARAKGAIPTGFPNVWQTIYAREREDEEVPGWVKQPNPFAGGGGAAGGMGGRVVNLSGARPVGLAGR